MKAPQLTVGLVGCEHISFSRYLHRAGNPVIRIHKLDDIKKCDAILIDVRDEELSDVVLDLLPGVREGQIIIHTCPCQPVQALQPLADYLTYCAAVVPLNPQGSLFFIDAIDELSAEVVQLLITELYRAAEPDGEAPRFLPAGPRTAYDALRVINNARQAMRTVMTALGPAEGRLLLEELLQELS